MTSIQVPTTPNERSPADLTNGSQSLPLSSRSVKG